MKKKIFLFIILSLFVSKYVNSQISSESLKFGEVLSKISRYYVDTINETKILDEVISNMLHDLDPHSAYLRRDEVSASQEQLDGGFEGIGVSFNILRDTIFIINPISGGPSEKVGIRPGDRIIFIEGENVAGTGIANIDVQKKLKGPKNTKVNISILRRHVSELLDFTITRDKIPLFSLDASYMIDNNTGYVKLSRFSTTTSNEFIKAVKELKQEGMQDLILDLSGNGGGYLFSAVDLADQFLEGRRKIVYTEGVQNPRRDFYSTNSGDFINGGIVVMIDETSASASEIVAGALQDWDRAVIVGRRSFGKGLVQGRFELHDGSELRLTVAKYYTPSGRLIQKPYETGYDEYSKDLLNRYNSGELSGDEEIDFPDSLKYRTLVKKRIVYGGGGISPDYFVSIDTSVNSDYYRKLISRGILNSFILSYVDKNRKDLEQEYPDIEVFQKEFNGMTELMNQLIKYAEKEGLEYVQEDYEKSKERIYILARAYIARDLWNTSEFYRIYNDVDPIFLKAKEISNNAALYEAKLKTSE
ncbi:MAG: S41 family peptidase [Bacteroidales bacterium]|nr:S41 family peptidase [Bacteroidales bacterium]